LPVCGTQDLACGEIDPEELRPAAEKGEKAREEEEDPQGQARKLRGRREGEKREELGETRWTLMEFRRQIGSSQTEGHKFQKSNNNNNNKCRQRVAEAN